MKEITSQNEMFDVIRNLECFHYKQFLKYISIHVMSVNWFSNREKTTNYWEKKTVPPCPTYVSKSSPWEWDKDAKGTKNEK